MPVATLSESTQERYDHLIDYINELNIENDEKEYLIELIDDVVDYALTEERYD